ncbi:hypothetical protein [Floridanema aerugineum]|uniref:Uncharacterized protein n=1 Tax=Floridaenema aerugineum BLCC-F46 TaxID=3153654 RepID=A0ABV4XHX9_9CYAN
MKPKITNMVAWQQAELLMQPAYLRIVDNLRKQLEQSAWKGTYEEVQNPYPGYLLRLQHNDRDFSISLWELCFQVCFLEYQPTHSELESQDVQVDTSLIDETGDVDWERLEAKTQRIIEEIFTNLPAT